MTGEYYEDSPINCRRPELLVHFQFLYNHLPVAVCPACRNHFSGCLQKESNSLPNTGIKAAFEFLDDFKAVLTRFAVDPVSSILFPW